MTAGQRFGISTEKASTAASGRWWMARPVDWSWVIKMRNAGCGVQGRRYDFSALDRLGKDAAIERDLRATAAAKAAPPGSANGLLERCL
jgi:hypothetical protein